MYQRFPTHDPDSARKIEQRINGLFLVLQFHEIRIPVMSYKAGAVGAFTLAGIGNFYLDHSLIPYGKHNYPPLLYYAKDRAAYYMPQ